MQQNFTRIQSALNNITSNLHIQCIRIKGSLLSIHFKCNTYKVQFKPISITKTCINVWFLVQIAPTFIHDVFFILHSHFYQFHCHTFFNVRISAAKGCLTIIIIISAHTQQTHVFEEFSSKKFHWLSNVAAKNG